MSTEKCEPVAQGLQESLECERFEMVAVVHGLQLVPNVLDALCFQSFACRSLLFV